MNGEDRRKDKSPNWKKKIAMGYCVQVSDGND